MQEYYSMTMRYSSENGKNPEIHGSRNIVSVKNGQGFKQVETLNKNGEIVDSVKHHLSKNELNTVMKGIFVPGFWSNCNRANTLANTLPKTRKTKPRSSNKTRSNKRSLPRSVNTKRLPKTGKSSATTSK